MVWLTVVFVACSILVGGAVLRVAGGVFYGSQVSHIASPFAAEPAGVTAVGLLTGAGSAAGAVLLALAALYWRRLPVLRRGFEPGAGLAAPIREFQSGVINDYITWLALGVACLGGVLALVIR